MSINRRSQNTIQNLHYRSRFLFACTALVCVTILSGCATSGPSPIVSWWNGPSSPKTLASKMKVPQQNYLGSKEVNNPGTLHLKYARWQEELGNLVEARESYEQALTSNPRSTDALIGLARISQLAGRAGEAERGYNKALQMEPNNPQSLDAIGQFYAAEERWDDAVDVLNKAMLAAPKEPLYRFHLAVAMTKQGDINGALAHFSHTVGEAEGHYNIGRILATDGKLQQAEDQFLMALSRKPSLSEAQSMLQEVRHNMGENVRVVNAEAPVEMRIGQSQDTSSFLNGYQRGTQLTAPNIPGGRSSSRTNNVDFSGNQMGHSSAPAMMSPVRTGSQTGFSPRSNTGQLTAAQREQMQNQLHNR